MGATTTYTYATSTSAYLNPHAVATTTAGSSLAYTYDNNGNLLTVRQGTSTPASSYTWDYNNRITQAVVNGTATSTYAYDYEGQRVKMTVATTSSATTYYPSKYYNITGSTPTKNIFLPDGTLIATVVGTGATTTVSYIHTDHLGGMNVATSDTGEVQQLSDYLPYGNTRIDEQNGFSSQRKFANYEFDPASNLNYLNQRYYNSTDARFLSQDPVFLKLGDKPMETWNDYVELQLLLSDPQQLNSYSYAKNNPLTNTDPNGEWAIPLPLIGGGSIVGLGSLLSGVGAVIVLGYELYQQTQPIIGSDDPILSDTDKALQSGKDTPQQIDGQKNNSQAKPERGLAPDGTTPPVEDPGKLKIGPASRPTEAEKGGKSYWDPKGGEWRYAPEDKYRNPHWDYNPHQPGQLPDGKPGNEWRNIPIDNQPTHKPNVPTVKK